MTASINRNDSPTASSQPPLGLDYFDRVRYIMVHPSHPGNVGAAARAIKTMGFRRLTLVAPHIPDMIEQAEAQALASGATDVLTGVNTVASLADALQGVTLAFAMTARPRDLGPPALDIREAAQTSRQHLGAHAAAEVAVVLGTERSGLTNEDIALCQRVCHIPANPVYSSLNVAQALQLAAWELRYALALDQHLLLLPTTNKQNLPEGSQPASNDQVQAFLNHWQEMLIAIGFLNPAHPKKLVPRMQHLFSRVAMTKDETDMMRGVCTAVLRSLRRSEKHD